MELKMQKNGTEIKFILNKDGSAVFIDVNKNVFIQDFADKYIELREAGFVEVKS